MPACGAGHVSQHMRGLAEALQHCTAQPGHLVVDGDSLAVTLAKTTTVRQGLIRISCCPPSSLIVSPATTHSCSRLLACADGAGYEEAGAE